MGQYPCNCSPCVGCVSYPSCPSGNCLQAASLVIPAENSIPPCGSTGTVDIGAESDLSLCETTISWWLDSWDSIAFEDVTIDSNGVLEFTSTNSAEAGKTYEFTGHVTCSGSYLSQYFYVKVIVKNLCFGVTCPEGESCSPCTGECGESPDVEVS